ncbi:SPOR domain-containing protein [Psychromonas sp. PT13]|uniref:SPOR domain-containing protein n=1 Tax=Psychromonas sp. PT13 TaxID=3439547 RepID=UPI003EBED458
MKNIKLLTVTFLFSSILAGCGMKGPLYQSENSKQIAATVETEQVPLTNTPSVSDETVIIGEQTVSAGTTTVPTSAISNTNDAMTTANKTLSTNVTASQTTAMSNANDALAMGNQAVSTGTAVINTGATPTYVQQAAINEPTTQDSLSQNTIFTPASKLLAVPATQFALQLAALDSNETLNNFIRIHNLPQPDISIYATEYNNLPRYIILFGQYTSRESAKMASKSLPGTFANMETWVKSFQLIHQELLVKYK